MHKSVCINNTVDDATEVFSVGIPKNVAKLNNIPDKKPAVTASHQLNLVLIIIVMNKLESAKK